MNRGYNEERYRPLDDDWQNQPETSKASAKNEPASRERPAQRQDKSRFSPETSSRDAERNEDDEDAPE